MKKRGLFILLLVILVGLVVYFSRTDWKESDGVVYFSVTSDGTTGEQWVNRLKKDGFILDGNTDSILRSASFCPTNKVTYVVAVFKGYLFTDSRRTDQGIREDAKERMSWLNSPNIELACLIREKLSDRKMHRMGIEYLLVMHQPVMKANGEEFLFCLGEDYDGNSDCLYADGNRGQKRTFADYDGFAFAWIKK